MKVSILLHNRDRADVLEPCLASVAAQMHRPLQVVIHDAGSVDESAAVIERWIPRLAAAGIEAGAFGCEPKGVAASRNDLAHRADGELLFFFDNDAVLDGPGTIGAACEQFDRQERLGLVSARISLRDEASPDPMAWVFRRDPAVWWSRPFETFTFAGTASCIRADAFRELGGYWDVLPYAREEEDLALGLLDAGWTIRYEPRVTVRHYPSDKGRLDIRERRRVELRNGIMVLWRRLPAPVALLSIIGRLTTSVRRAIREQQSVCELLGALPDARRFWCRERCRRKPVRWEVVRRYLALHRAHLEAS